MFLPGYDDWKTTQPEDSGSEEFCTCPACTGTGCFLRFGPAPSGESPERWAEENAAECAVCRGYGAVCAECAGDGCRRCTSMSVLVAGTVVARGMKDAGDAAELARSSSLEHRTRAFVWDGEDLVGGYHHGAPMNLDNTALLVGRGSGER